MHLPLFHQHQPALSAGWWQSRRYEYELSSAEWWHNDVDNDEVVISPVMVVMWTMMKSSLAGWWHDDVDDGDIWIPTLLERKREYYSWWSRKWYESWDGRGRYEYNNNLLILISWEFNKNIDCHLPCPLTLTHQPSPPAHLLFVISDDINYS
jgi:hypothetical protein